MITSIRRLLMKNIKNLSVLVIALGLTACGSGGSGGSSGSDGTGGNTGGGNTGGNSTYVSGQFKDASSTGQHFAKIDPANGIYDNDLGSMASSCKDATKYFESDKVMVYGSDSISEDHFKRSATLVQNNISWAMSSMNTTFEQFNEDRIKLAKFAVSNMMTAIEQMDFYGKPDNFDSMSYDEKKSWSYQYIRSMSTQDQITFAIQAGEYNGYTYTKEDVIYQDKVIVCLKDSNNTGASVGEGHRLGLSLAVPAIFNKQSYEQLIKHELIHTVQTGIAYSFEGNIIPRWFAEGQAVYLAGQDIASESEVTNYYVPDYVYAYDENGEDYGKLYSHYGLAYKYLLDANSSSKMVEVIYNTADNYYPFMQLNALPDDYEYHYYDLTGNQIETAPFIMGFDQSQLKMKNGAQLKFIEWKNHYHTVMNTK